MGSNSDAWEATMEVEASQLTTRKVSAVSF
jgi:hypothetical protein